jgi:alpha-N-arabinofuranosidase
VTTELLGKAMVPDAPFVQPCGAPYRIDTDYFGKQRNTANPVPGPFENPAGGAVRLK